MHISPPKTFQASLKFWNIFNDFPIFCKQPQHMQQHRFPPPNSPIHLSPNIREISTTSEDHQERTYVNQLVWFYVFCGFSDAATFGQMFLENDLIPPLLRVLEGGIFYGVLEGGCNSSLVHRNLRLIAPNWAHGATTTNCGDAQ